MTAYYSDKITKIRQEIEVQNPSRNIPSPEASFTGSTTFDSFNKINTDKLVSLISDMNSKTFG